MAAVCFQKHTVQAAKFIQQAEKTNRLMYAELSVALAVFNPRLCLQWSFVMVETQNQSLSFDCACQ